MTSGTVTYGAPPVFALYDLKFQPSNPSQLDIPSNMSGTWIFDSTFDITYEASVSFGLGPVFPVSGVGTAHVIGSAPNAMPQVFDSEILALELQGLSLIPEFIFRESPTLESVGVIIREDACPECGVIIPIWRISSFFDVFTEVSFDAGVSRDDTTFTNRSCKRPSSRPFDTLD